MWTSICRTWSRTIPPLTTMLCDAKWITRMNIKMTNPRMGISHYVYEKSILYCESPWLVSSIRNLLPLMINKVFWATLDICRWLRDPGQRSNAWLPCLKWRCDTMLTKYVWCSTSLHTGNVTCTPALHSLRTGLCVGSYVWMWVCCTPPCTSHEFGRHFSLCW